MKLHRVASLALCLLAMAGCAKTTVTESQTYQGPRLGLPDRIIVYDFAATAEDLPAFAAMPGRHATPSTPATPEQVAAGRKLGAQVAEELVAEIRGMTLPAVRAAAYPSPGEGDIVIVGYFESVDEGSAAKRVVLGFGSGAAELKTHVEGFLMTPQGLRKIGSGDVDAGGGKSPGVIVPLAVAVATDNPIGLLVGTAAHVAGEATGRTTIEGSAKRTAKKIADQLRLAFQRQGWI
jgi:hypothetical protein